MDSAEDLLAELVDLATTLGPAVRPPGYTATLTSLVGSARRAVGAAACSLALLSDDEDELHYVAAAGEGAEQVVGLRTPAVSGLGGWVVRSGQPISVTDLTGDARFDRAAAERTGYVPDAMVVLPAATDRRTYGVLSVLDRDASRPGAADDLALLQLVADQAAVVLEGMATFGDLGRVLLAALTEAAGEGGGLGPALARQAEGHRGRDADLGALASAFAELGRRGVAERRLALGVLREVAGYAARSGSRTR